MTYRLGPEGFCEWPIREHTDSIRTCGRRASAQTGFAWHLCEKHRDRLLNEVGGLLQGRVLPEQQVRRLVREVWWGYGVEVADEFLPAVAGLIDEDKLGTSGHPIHDAVDRLMDRRMSQRWAS